jgi:hypothetical protein
METTMTLATATRALISCVSELKRGNLVALSPADFAPGFLGAFRQGTALFRFAEQS